MIGNITNSQNEASNLKQNSNLNTNNNIAYNSTIKNNVENKTTAGILKKDINKVEDKKNKNISCETCNERRYQDDSNDSGVSFQTPTRINPQQASSLVLSHEKEHYSREAQRAENENKDVLVNNIRVHSSVCPDCGKIYISGGETTTVTRTRAEASPSPLKEIQVDGLNLDIGL